MPLLTWILSALPSVACIRSFCCGRVALGLTSGRRTLFIIPRPFRALPSLLLSRLLPLYAAAGAGFGVERLVACAWLRDQP